MKRIPLPHAHELRVLHRRGSGVRGAESVVISIYRMSDVVGVIAVPTAIFDDVRKAIAGLSIADIIRPPAPEEQGSVGTPPTERPTP